MTRSNQAKKAGIKNTPSSEIVARMKYLVTNLLDPLRELYGYPILVSSGFRSPELNELVGGAKTSQHLKGEAADIISGKPFTIAEIEAKAEILEPGAKLTKHLEDLAIYELRRDENRKLHALIQDNFTYDQLIDESNMAWVHVSLKAGAHNRFQSFKL